MLHHFDASSQKKESGVLLTSSARVTVHMYTVRIIIVQVRLRIIIIIIITIDSKSFLGEVSYTKKLHSYKRK